jgi:CubicO group peptidase (beta-lactamase class C family)
MQLVGEGRLDLDAPVCHYWPAFANAGKASITVRQVLCHRAGLPALRTPLAPETLYDWNTMTDLIAEEHPWAAAGEQQTYSPLLFGWILGELLRRVDGLTPAQSIHRRVAVPLGLDFHIGLDDATIARCAYMARTKDEIDDEAFGRVLNDVLNAPTAMSALAFANPPMVLGRSNETGWKPTRGQRTRQCPQPGSVLHRPARRAITGVAVAQRNVVRAQRRIRSDHPDPNAFWPGHHAQPARRGERQLRHGQRGVRPHGRRRHYRVCRP